MSEEKPVNKARIAVLAALAFITMMSYAMARNPIDSIFLQHNSSKGLPLAWIFTAIGAALTIWVYNRYNARFSMLKIYFAASIISLILLAVILSVFNINPSIMSYALYIWKEMYIVVLVEIFWSYSDIIFSIKTARRLYGILLAFGSLGGMTGSLIIGPAAKLFSTQTSLWFLIPLLLLCGFIARLTARRLGDPVPPASMKKKTHLVDGLKVLNKSRYLIPLLIVVVIVQMATALIDFSYNNFLETNFTNLDVRTDAMGKIHAMVDLVAVSLQLSTGIILRFIGVAGTLLSIPTLVGSSIALFVIAPQVSIIVIVRVVSKSLDYSLFRAAKEILYIPLSHAEKTQGKAFIDILAYRFGKGTSSIILMGLIQIGLASYSIYLAFALVVAWLLLTLIISRRYRSIVSFEEELELHRR